MNNRKNNKNVINLKLFPKKKKKSFKLISNFDFHDEFNNKKYKINSKRSLQILTNNINIIDNSFLKKYRIKRNKSTTDYYNIKDERKKRTLSKEQKEKLISIIKKFKNNKLATSELFNKEKQFPLNSINKSNFDFFIGEEEKNNKSKKYIKNLKKSSSTLLTSSMVNKFNAKTSSILDIAFPNSLQFSKNISSFRKQILNSFVDQEDNLGYAKYSKNKYKNALDIFDETEDKKMKKILKNEKQFYKLKNKEIGLYEVVLDKEKENKEDIIRFNSSKIINNLFSFMKRDKNNSKNNINDNNKTFNYKYNSSKFELNSLLNKKKLIKNYNSKNIEKEQSLENKTINNNKIFFNEEKKKYNENITFDNTKIKIDKKEQKMKKYMKKFWFLQKMKILETSKRLANSISQMNFFHYIPKGYVDYKNSTLNIDSKNLTRIIKLIRINKYLCDVEDDDLLVMDSTKLRQLMKKAEIQYYLCNKNDFQLSYLRKNLRPQTISKFCSIKNSFFGLPC